MGKRLLLLIMILFISANMYSSIGNPIYEQGSTYSTIYEGFSVRFTPNRNITADTIRIYTNTTVDPATYRIGIQADVMGSPSDTFLSSALISPVGYDWNTIDIPDIILNAGTTYHLVYQAESLSGSPLYSYAIYIYGALPIIPYDGFLDTTITTFGRSLGVWTQGGGTSLPVFVIEDTGGEHYGQPYTTQGYSMIHSNGTAIETDNIVIGQTFYGPTYVTQVAAITINGGGGIAPGDDLMYSIENLTDSLTVSNGVMLSPGEVPIFSSWVTKPISPFTLEPGKQYRLTFYTSGSNSNSTNYYRINSIKVAENFDSVITDTTYQGSSNSFLYSSTGFSGLAAIESEDLAFELIPMGPFQTSTVTSTITETSTFTVTKTRTITITSTITPTITPSLTITATPSTTQTITNTLTNTPAIPPTLTPIATEAACVHRDATFDEDGIYIDEFLATGSEFNAIGIDSQNRIILGGYMGSKLTYWRLNQNGTVDTSFLAGGYGGFVSAYGQPNIARDLVVLPGDGILLTGKVVGSSGTDDLMIVMLDSTGTFVSSFNGGTVSHNSAAGGNGDDYGARVEVDGSGRIVVSGASQGPDGNYDIAVWRYLANGTLDTSFNGTGYFTFDAGANGGGNGSGMIIDSLGRIYITGFVYNGTDYDMILMRLNDNGTLDTTFNSPLGYVQHNGGAGGNGQDFGNSVAIDSSGKILVTGQSDNVTAELVIYKFNQDGTFDTSFGTNGIVSEDMNGGAGGLDSGNEILLNGSGSIIIAGETGGAGSTGAAMGLWKFNADGTLDTTFNGTGYVSNDNPAGGNGNDYSNKFVIDSNGDYIMAGMARGPAYDRAALWKYVDYCALTPTVTQSVTPTITAAITQTITRSATPSMTKTITSTVTPEPTQTLTVTFTATLTVTPTITPFIQSVELDIDKTASGTGAAEVGSIINYSIVIENNSMQDVESVAVWDSLPDKVKFLGSVDMTPVPTPDTANVILWKTGMSLTAGQSMTFRFRAKIIELADGDAIANRAACDYNDALYSAPSRHPAILSDVAFYPAGKVVVFPNPFNPDKAMGGCMKFDNLIDGSTVEIYTLSGEFVWKALSDGITARWYGENRLGSRVSPGIYYYIVYNAATNDRMLGKLFVVNK